jgi:hypothetical protein
MHRRLLSLIKAAQLHPLFQPHHLACTIMGITDIMGTTVIIMMIIIRITITIIITGLGINN